MTNKLSLEISQEYSKKLNDPVWILNQLNQGVEAQNLVGFDKALMARCYAAACQLIEQKHFSEAAEAFFFLTALCPEEQCYWLGLGSARQGCNDYEAAIDAYEVAAINQIESPVPYFHLSKCLFAIHDRDNALQAIELALEYSDGISEFDELHQHALIAKSLILKEQQ